MAKLAIEDVDSHMVDAGSDVWIPASWVAVVTGLDGIPGAVTAQVVYDPSLRRAAAAWVRIDRSGESDEVTTTLLRDVRVQAVVQWSAASVVKIFPVGADPLSYAAYSRSLQEQPDRTDDETLRAAVTLYRIGSVVNYGPLKMVSDRLGVSVSTATRMMNRARVAGLVDEQTGQDVMSALRQEQIRESFSNMPHQSHSGPSGPSLGI